jgi:hypothetical protein
MTDGFTCDDLERLSAAVVRALTAAADRDWTARAGTLEWSCLRTAAHAVDTVLAPAFFLASRQRDHYPAGRWIVTPEDDTGADPATLVESLETATRVTCAVIRSALAEAATGVEVRAILWRRGGPEVRPPEDFPPRAGMELALHGHDVCVGLGIRFAPDADVAARLRAHTRSWPYWTSDPPWSALSMTEDPWSDLLQSSGRAPQ